MHIYAYSSAIKTDLEMSKGEHELTERDKNGNDVENKQERQPEVDHEQVDFMEGELDDAFWIEVLKAVPFSLKKTLWLQISQVLWMKFRLCISKGRY